MNPTALNEAKALLNSLSKFQAPSSKLQPHVWIAPPSLFIHPLIQQFGNHFDFGLQNIFYEKHGAYTGELSAVQAKDVGAKFVILGHSERKKMGENLQVINKKVLAALAMGLKVILCFGETTKKNNGRASETEWEQQAKELFRNLPKAKEVRKNLIIAFEPAWAISTAGQGSISVEYLQAFTDWFKQNISSKFQSVKLLYGGSVNAAVAAKFIETDIDGFLLGSASLNLPEMKKIITIIKR